MIGRMDHARFEDLADAYGADVSRWPADARDAAALLMASEPAFTGEYTDTETVGVYHCRACGAELFRSDAKFHSGCGWPSFYEPSSSDAVVLIEDRSHGMIRVEARCARCDSHLGHVFTGEGYETPTDERWCINSVSLTLEPAG